MLDDRFRLLTGGSRSVQRHRTLRATVQWSYDHLEPEEQEFFVALSVFSGGWTLEAAAHMADEDEFQVLDLLTRLIDKSLVLMERKRSGGETRYRMLETLRQFGLEILAGSGRAEAVRARHFDYFHKWVESMRDALWQYYHTDDEIRMLKADMDNLRAALTWGFQEQPGPATEITKVLFPLWDDPGYYYAEGRRWYQRILERGEAVDPAERAHVLGRSGRLAFKQGDYPVYLAYQEERSRIFEELGDDKRLARSLALQGTGHAYMGNPEKALPLYERARTVYDALGEASLIGRLETAVGLASFLLGDFEEARHRFELGLVQAEKDESEDRVQTAIGNIALVDVMQGKPADARRRIRQCMEINRKLTNLYGISHDLPALAEASRQEGDAEGAARWIGACDALLEKIDAKLEGLERDTYQRVSAALRKELGDEAFDAAREEGRKLSWEEIVEQA
jgi:non-specific serine/threonine protein kinase